MDNFDLADIAAGIMNTDMKEKGITVSKNAHIPLDESVDISDVEIPKELVDAWTGNGEPVELVVNENTTATVTATDREGNETTSTVEVKVTEQKENLKQELSEMVSKFTTLLGEARTLLTEMTTCGMIGTNMGGPAEDPFKDEEDKKKKKKKKRTEEVDEGSMGLKNIARKRKALFKKEKSAKDSGSTEEYYDAAKKLGNKTKKGMYKHTDSVGKDESKPRPERIAAKTKNNRRRKNRTTKNIDSFNESVEDILNRVLRG